MGRSLYIHIYISSSALSRDTRELTNGANILSVDIWFPVIFSTEFLWKIGLQKYSESDLPKQMLSYNFLSLDGLNAHN